MRPVLVLVAVCLLAGCSNRAIYDNIRFDRKNECLQMPATMFDACMERLDMSYDEYQRERSAVLDEARVTRESVASFGGPSMTGLKTRIETTRFEASVDFYRDILGMSVLDEWDDADDRGAILGFGPAASGGAFIEIAHSESVADHEGISLQFRVSDLDGMSRRLDGRWAYRGPETRPWGSRYLYLRDPAGVRVILYEGDL